MEEKKFVDVLEQKITRLGGRWFFDYIEARHAVFALAWAAFYVSFLLLSLPFPDAALVMWLRYMGLMLCMVFVLRNFFEDRLLVLAMGLTLIADAILAIDSVSVWGVVVFGLVQSVHFLRLEELRTKSLVWHILAVLMIAGAGFCLSSPVIFVVGAIYAFLLLSNVFLGWQWYQKTGAKAARNGAFGMSLLLCCDFCVMLSFLSFSGVLPAVIFGVANYLAWAFYFPSQVLIANSSKIVL